VLTRTTSPRCSNQTSAKKCDFSAQKWTQRPPPWRWWPAFLISLSKRKSLVFSRPVSLFSSHFSIGRRPSPFQPASCSCSSSSFSTAACCTGSKFRPTRAPNPNSPSPTSSASAATENRPKPSTTGVFCTRITRESPSSTTAPSTQPLN